MKKNILLVRASLRRGKGQTAAIVVLIFLAAAMLNIWLMLSMDYKQNFERSHERLNEGHVTFVADGDSGKMGGLLEEAMENDGRTAQFSIDPAMHMVGLFRFHGGEVNSEFVFLEKEAAVSRPVGRVEIIEDSSYKSGIYMPILYQSDSIAIGKTIYISIGSRKIPFQVCGFFNSVMAGSHNCGVCGLLLTEDKYKELKEKGYASEAALCSVRLKDKSESEDYEAMLKNTLSSAYPAARMKSNSYALVSSSRYISQMISSGILSAMAFFVLLIALVVIASAIMNDIQENMKNLGALKAVGYTRRQLTGALLLQFLGIAMAAAIMGAGVSYGLFPAINEMMVSQTGIPYEIRFLPAPFFLVLGILGGAVSIAVWVSSGKMRKVEPITALRQGVQTHNFKRNHISLENTKAPLDLALALKTACSSIRQNVAVCITMLVLSLVAVFSGLMVENMIADILPFLNLIVGETADSCIHVNAQAEEAFLEKIKEDKRVEKAYLYHSAEVRHVGGVDLPVTLSDDFSQLNNQDVVFQGRFPKYENEIAIAAKYAKEEGFQLGQEIRVTADGKQADYLISGFTQMTNNLGKDCLMTREGYGRLGELRDVGYYLNLTEGTDIDAFHSEVKEWFGSDVNAVINIEATVEGAASVYVSLMRAIVAAVLVLGLVIIAFVLYLLVRTTMGNKRQEYGIMKALGYTTGQLILQTALSFMPAAIISTVIGITVCSFLINPLTAVFIRNIGIVECTFRVPARFNILAGAGMVLAAFAILCLLALRIRKVQPKELMG